MFHLHYVGHFDPRDAFDRPPGEPPRPKPLRPVSREAFEQTSARSDATVAQFVDYCPEGWGVCRWTEAEIFRLSQAVGDFAKTLAENNGAVVMTEMCQIIFPAWARRAQEEHFASRE
jgi:hypothetical protein